MARAVLMPVPSPTGLYDPRFEHDACGVGFLADLAGGQESSVLPLALLALARMNHRGAVDADGRTGDGAGVITQIPRAVLRADLPPGHLGVGMLFLPLDRGGAARARSVVGEALAAEGLAARGWREVPVQEEVLGARAWRWRPGIEQVLVERPAGDSADEFERRLYRARQGMEARATDGRLDGFYVASLSHRTIVYKAMVQAVDLSEFYLDLRHPDYATAFAVFHQRFSTNTLPSWAMTQPFRLLAHNGEINTIEGNRAWMRAREATLAAPRLGLFPGARGPVLTEGGSDSASLDEALGLLTAAGRDVLQGMSLLVPPAWEGDPEMAAEVRDFFDYQSCLMEPWDGPALAVFTDGRTVGAALDRNGLRPARYLVTVDGLVLLASEVGVLAVEEERVLRRGRLGPGDVLAVDLRAGRLLDRETVHRSLAGRRRPPPRTAGARRRPSNPSGPSATAARSCSSCSGPCTARGSSPSGRWATTRPWPCSRSGPASSIRTSSSASPRSRTLPSIPCASPWSCRSGSIWGRRGTCWRRLRRPRRRSTCRGRSCPTGISPPSAPGGGRPGRPAP